MPAGDGSRGAELTSWAIVSYAASLLSFPSNVKTRNAVQTRDRIRKAATEEFSLRGIDAARLERVAKRAGVTTALIYYYFKSKDGLFQAVIEHAYETLRAAQQDLTLAELGPVEGIERLVRSTYHAFLDIPEIIPLARSENMQGARHLKRSKIIRRLFNPLPSRIDDLLARGCQNGIFRRDIDPIELYVSIVSLCSYHISNQHSLSVVLSTDLMGKARRARREQHIVDFVLGYLIAPRTPDQQPQNLQLRKRPRPDSMRVTPSVKRASPT